MYVAVRITVAIILIATTATITVIATAATITITAGITITIIAIGKTYRIVALSNSSLGKGRGGAAAFSLFRLRPDVRGNPAASRRL